PITLLNSLYKGFSTILTNKITNFLITNKIIPNEQAGFLPNRDTSTPIQTLLEILKYSNHLNTEIHLCYIDFFKAFDSCQFPTILEISKRIGLSPLLPLLRNIILNNTTEIETAYGPTPSVSFNKGVKQGDPLSPLLFLIFMIPLNTN